MWEQLYSQAWIEIRPALVPRRASLSLCQSFKSTMPKAQSLVAHCWLPLLHLYCLLGSAGAVNMGLLPSCFWHFYLLSHKAWKAMNLGMSSRLHKHQGWGEMGSGCGYIFLQSWHFYTTLSQLTAGASRTVEPWPHIIVGSIPGQAWSPCQNFGGWTFRCQGNQYSLERKSTPVLWLLRCIPSLRSPQMSSLQNRLPLKASRQQQPALLPELPEMPENEICPDLAFPTSL